MISSGTPWLTIVMPVHNGADFLSETLDSLVQEVDESVEIILIDSSDDDACKEIVEEYQDRLSIDYSHRADLKPWPAKTNEAVRRAQAPHIAMLHQDDLWLTGRVEHIRAAIRAYPSATMYLAPSHIINSRSKSLGIWRCPFGKRKLWQGDDLLERLLVQNFIAIPSPIIFRESWLAVGGMDENLWYTADWDLYLKLASRGPYMYTDKATTAFRIHSASLTVTGSKSLDDFQRQMEIVVDRHATGIGSPHHDRALRLARISITINTALAAFLAGEPNRLWKAIWAFLRLAPPDLLRYIYYSRILERSWPRVRANFHGAL